MEEEEEEEKTFEDVREDFQFWLEIYQDLQKYLPKEFRFTYKKGCEPDVLAYLILSEEEQKKFFN